MDEHARGSLCGSGPQIPDSHTQRLSNDRLIYQTCEVSKKRIIKTGAVQGSVLESDLRNLAYDRPLKVEFSGQAILSLTKDQPFDESGGRLVQDLPSLALVNTKVLILTKNRINILVSVDGKVTLTGLKYVRPQKRWRK